MGQTAINLTNQLVELNVPIIGTDALGIAKAEDRDLFEGVLEKLNINRPIGHAVTTVKEALKTANEIGYPVLVRPSYVLGGRGMEIVYQEDELHRYITGAISINKNYPVLIDKYITGREAEVDAICDGTNIFIPGIMEHIEKTGVHSGDSISVYPAFSISDKTTDKMIAWTKALGLEIGIKGLFNIQFIIDEHDELYIIEVNPRSSRTVPFISKATNVDLAEIATKVMLGISLETQGYVGLHKKSDKHFVKAPVFSFSKIKGMDYVLSPEMKSTGEAIGYDKSLNKALYKALRAAGMKVQNYGTLFVTVSDDHKDDALPLVKRFYDLGFNIEATSGTANFLRENGIRTRTKKKISEGSNDIPETLSKGYVTYVINTISSSKAASTDGFLIRKIAIENNIPMLTSLDTINVLLDVIEDMTLSVSSI